MSQLKPNWGEIQRKSGWSISALAREIGMSELTLKKILRGQMEPEHAHIWLLLKVLKLPE